MKLITEYEYDVASNLIKAISPKGNVTEYGVDLSGTVTKITLPNGGGYHYTYDKIGIIKMTSPLGYEKKLKI